MKQIRWLLVTVILGSFLAGCAGGKSSNGSENQNFNVPELKTEPLAGTVFGKPWVAKIAALKREDFMPDSPSYYIEIFSESMADICTRPPITGKLRASALLKQPLAVGTYKNEITNPSSTMQALAFDDGQPSPTIFVSEVTVLNISEVNSAGFVGQFYSRSADYEINGQIEIVDCLHQ
jgi:hypothetical protein